MEKYMYASSCIYDNMNMYIKRLKRAWSYARILLTAVAHPGEA